MMDVLGCINILTGYFVEFLVASAYPSKARLFGVSPSLA